MAGINIRDLTPAYLIHPGEILNDELEARDISPEAFAQSIGINVSELKGYLKGKEDFSEEFCISVAKALGMKKHVWFNLMENYKRNKVKIEERDRQRTEELK